jgi:hypothetical protein
MKKPVNSFRTGQGTVGVAAQVALPELGMAVQRCIKIRAAAGNAGQIYIGRIGVTAGTGFELSATQELELEFDRPGAIYVIASAASQKYSWIAQ